MDSQAGKRRHGTCDQKAGSFRSEERRRKFRHDNERDCGNSHRQQHPATEFCSWAAAHVAFLATIR